MKATGALKKAEIIIYGEGEVETSVPCSINPSQYAIKNSVNYKEAASLGTDVSSLVFLSGTKYRFAFYRHRLIAFCYRLCIPLLADLQNHPRNPISIFRVFLSPTKKDTGCFPCLSFHALF